MSKMEEDESKPTNHKLDQLAPDMTEETRCGFLGWYPKWMQVFASKKAFILIYGLLGMNEGGNGSYYVATLTTFEKRFKLPSKYSGMISSSFDLGGLIASMFVAYVGGGGHKTRWVAYWSLFASLATFMTVTPHLIFGPGEGTIDPGARTSAGFNATNNTIKSSLCTKNEHVEEICSLNDEGTIAFIIVCISQILLGIGTAAYYTLGAAYLDDNVEKRKFPFLFAIAACLKYIGPTWGFMLASYTLKIYINPDVTPNFGVDDPRWIGCWHLGWIPLALVEGILAIVIAFFPRTLPREAMRRQNLKEKAKSAPAPSFEDFCRTVKRLLSNRILVLNTISTTFYVFGMMAYWMFLPKYIETQFRKSASETSIISGAAGLFCAALGLLTSGAVVSRFKPSPRALAFWNLVTESSELLGALAFGFISCSKDDLQGHLGDNGKWTLDMTCNSQCACDANLLFTPVCSKDGTQMFYSPCHAGCLGVQELNGTKVFTGCSCIAGGGIATDGFCPVDCETQFTIFLALMCFLRFFSATGRAGNVIIQYRSVAPEDKSVSISFSTMILSATTFIPAPIFFGMLIDSTCQVWGYTCGERGNCLLYLGNDIRYLLNFTASGFMFIGLLVDVGVYYSVGSLKIYDDENEDAPSKEWLEEGNTEEKQSIIETQPKKA